MSRSTPWRLAVIFTLALVPDLGRATQPDDKAKALDQQIIAQSQKDSSLLPNITHLSDMIGPRLTGSPALKRANDWAADRMKALGLTNVHHEAWLMPEGWERGTASARVIEPDTNFKLTVASAGWNPGTDGKVEGEVMVMTAAKSADLEQYRGKLKGKVILRGPPAKLTPLADIDKSGFGPPKKDTDKKPLSFEEFAAFQKELDTFLHNEGVVATITDSAKYHGLLNMGGGWSGNDRPSAFRKRASLFMAHEHYAMLHRLASRPAPEKTRIELEVSNKFIPGPLKVYNTVGEIRGKEKPEEYVIVGAHLDSWDLGQGTLDNGTGTCVVLETARILTKLPAPKRTIRFVLFTGEEQGLHGSRHYCDQHKEELPRMQAALVHDTGTGKVIGLGWMSNREELAPILETELACLKDLGVKELCLRGFGGSDHASFDRAGVPGMAFNQEVAGYRFAHHSQADTVEMLREDDLRQGVQVMATAALRLANLEKMLPRPKK
jgi:hypothetical protein